MKNANLHGTLLTNRWKVECFDKDGNLKWTEDFINLVTTEGLNAILNNTFNAAAGAVTWYVGLKNTGTPAAGDVMNSHASWTENVTYSDGTRPAWTKNGAASGGAMSNSSSKASFSINGSTTIYGAFLTSNSTKSGTTGTLYGVGDFSGSRAVISGDTLNVQVDLSATSA
jgi:hypothetical protein